MTNMKTLRWVKTAALLVAVLAYAAPAAAQEADLVVTVKAVTSPGGVATATLAPGATGKTAISVKNTGAVAATGVTVTVDSSAWPSDQVITAVSGCTPAVKPATPTAATNASWFPCAITTDIATEASVVAPATTNAKTVTISVKYGTAIDPATLYDDNGDKIEALWVCPATGHFAVVKASAATTASETNTGDNAATQAAAPNSAWADVSVETAGPASIGHGGGTFTFTTTVTNNGPCTVGTDIAVDDSWDLSAWTFVSASGICASLTDDYDADGNYQTCATGSLAKGATATGAKVYKMKGLASDLISSNQVVGVFIANSDASYMDPDDTNDVADAAYVVTKAMGCSSVGGGGPLALLGLGLAALVLRRRRS